MKLSMVEQGKKLENVVEFSRYTQQIRRKIWRLLIVMAVTAVVAFPLIKLIPSKYVATSAVMIKALQDDATPLPQLSRYDATRSDFYETQYALVQSRVVLQKAISELQLDNEPTFNGGFDAAQSTAENAALRLRQTRPVLQFTDRLRGTLVANEPLAREDFIIHRRDGLFAYNLAVVVDDHFQGITEIVRGADLIEPTVRQISLYQHFGWQAPDYVHLPLAVNAQGNKLSKQNHAPALPEGDPRPEIMRALMFLNQDIEQEWRALSIEDLLKNAVANWDLQKIQHSQMTLAEL